MEVAKIFYHASISANFAVWFELIEALPGLDAYRTITEASCDVVANPSASLTLRTEFRVVDSVACLSVSGWGTSFLRPYLLYTEDTSLYTGVMQAYCHHKAGLQAVIVGI